MPTHTTQQETSGLADSTLTQGEFALLKGDLETGLQLFKQASELEPSNAHFFFRQGLSLFEYGSEEGKSKALLLASRKFKSATTLNPHHFDSWFIWGNTLAQLGAAGQEHHYFQDAEEKYRKAAALVENESAEIRADLHWNMGKNWEQLFQFSGEALDLQLAIDFFQKASSLQSNMPADFWIDFGKSCFLLAPRINDIRLLIKAVHCLKHAISHAGPSYEAWILLAETFQTLYAYTHDEDHFVQANECFASAAQLKPQETSFWLKWAQFLCESGRRNQDIKRLRSCIEKCHRGYANNPIEPLIIATWAEALALIGELTGRLDLICDAQNKISEALAIDEDLPDVWYSFGMCLNSLGSYYSDSDYYYQAIEKFQQGISINRTCWRHWHAIAKTYTAIAAQEESIEELEKSLRFFSKAIDLQCSSFYLFDYALALSKLAEMTDEKRWYELAISQFEIALTLQKNAIYLHPEWLFHYAVTLDEAGVFHEDDSYYTKAIEIFSHVLMIDPDFPHIHTHLALAFSHLGESTCDLDHFHRSLHHYRLAFKHDEENDQILLDWALTLMHAAESSQDTAEVDQFYREAEFKLIQSAKLGNIHAYYNLAALYSLLGQYEKSLRFLEKSALFDSLPAIDVLLDDDWLEGVRSTSDFRALLAELEKRPIPESGER
jgi:tetratricopeptide (TPR) repeat protein